MRKAFCETTYQRWPNTIHEGVEDSSFSLVGFTENYSKFSVIFLASIDCWQCLLK